MKKADKGQMKEKIIKPIYLNLPGSLFDHFPRLRSRLINRVFMGGGFPSPRCRGRVIPSLGSKIVHGESSNFYERLTYRRTELVNTL